MKGAGTIMTVLMVVTAVIVVGISVSGVEWLRGLDDTIRYETVSIAEGRMESVIYTANAFNEADIQINYRAEYNLTREDNEKYIAFELPEESQVNGNRVNKNELNPPVDFSVTEGKSKSFCISKRVNSDVLIEPGEC